MLENKSTLSDLRFFTRFLNLAAVIPITLTLSFGAQFFIVFPL